MSILIASDARNGVVETLDSYRSTLEALDMDYEVVVVVKAIFTEQLDALRLLSRDWEGTKVIGLRPWPGDDAALATAIRRSGAELFLVLPGWSQIDARDIPKLFDALGEADLVSGVRTGPQGSVWQDFRHALFARVLRRLFGTAPSDPFCRARLVRRSTLEDVASFGVRQHFLPVIASQRGHNVTETTLSVGTGGDGKSARYVFKPIGHMRAMIDAFTLYIVLTFLHRPLRFFGAIGLPLFVVGSFMTVVMVLNRLFGDVALADRPALIFAVMMIVLGIQIIAIGLVGEIIIFAGARRMKQYDVAEVIGGEASGTDNADRPVPAQDPTH